jgi:hypothetical protein
MPAFQPNPSDFIARLQNDGWKFAISYLINFAITVWNIDIAPMTLAMVVLAVSAVNLVQTALNAGYLHSSGFLREPKMAALPITRRCVYYVFDGVHLCAVMTGFLSAANDPSNIMLILIIGLAGALGSALGSERRISKQS